MHKTNWQNGEHVRRKTLLMKCIHTACSDLKIVYWRARQRVMACNSGNPDPVASTGENTGPPSTTHPLVSSL
jgi:hypothetical protein